MNQTELNEILKKHVDWLKDNAKGLRADFSGADLSRADLSGADLSRAYLSEANLLRANLLGANLSEACLSRANLSRANLSRANLSRADLSEADLSRANLLGANLLEAYLLGADLSRACLLEANLSEADLSRADLLEANLSGANLSGADLSRACLLEADLSDTDLSGTIGLVKIIGVEKGNIYYKAISDKLINNGYQFKLGLNELKKDEIFASDEKVLCSYPGFHFASKSWCKLYYGNRPYLCKIRIPENALINEPWASDGKASADKIEILQILDMKTEKDITEQFKGE